VPYFAEDVNIDGLLRVRGILVPSTGPVPPTPTITFPVTNTNPGATSLGQPICADGKLGDASSTAHSDVIGIVAVGAGPTLPMIVQCVGPLLVGGLVPGARYYLGTVPGTITTIAPIAVGTSVVVIGHALADGATLVIEIDQPVLL
jgi:hypothetical protein